jgi:hypothetical protein
MVNPQVANQTVNGAFFDHVVVIYMENQGISQTCGGNPPPCNGGNNLYMDSLANTYGIAQQYTSLITTSWPDYYGFLGASIFGCPSNCYPPTGSITAPNLVDLFEASGITWKAYMESQPLAAGCATSDSGPYTIIHNGFIAFQDITNNTSRCHKIVLANPSTCPNGVNGYPLDCALTNDLNSTSAPNFMWLTPNGCNNMRSWSGCSDGCTSGGSTTCVKDGDNYLKNLIPKILNSKTFNTTRAALFLTFDEGSGFCPFNNSHEDCVYAVWAGPVVKTSYYSGDQFSHYSLTRTMEVNWNLTSLTSNDASATPMINFFKADYAVSATSPPPISVGQRANSTVTITGLNGWSGTAQVTESNTTGLTCYSNPSTITGSGNATVSCTTTLPGNYTITITASSGGLSHTASAFLRFQDFAISATSPTSAINSTTTTILNFVSVNGFNGTISLASTVPSGLACNSITPNGIAGGSGNATISCSSDLAGNYPLIITSTSGPITHNATATFRIQDFAITSSAPPSTLVNQTFIVTLTITSLNGFAGSISLSATSPPGMNCGPISPSIINGTGQASLNCTATQAGSYALWVSAAAGNILHTSETIVQVQSGSASTGSGGNGGRHLAT